MRAMRSVTWAGLSLVPLSWHSATGPALAQTADPSAVVVVRSGLASRSAAQALGPALVRELASRGLTGALPPPAPPPTDETDSLSDAESAYANLRPADARQALDALLARLDASGGEGVHREQLLAALLLHALSCFATAAPEQADASLDRALTIDPNLAPDESLYPPALRQRLAERRATRPDNALWTLRVDGAPEGAIIVVDAEPLSAGARQVDLASGQHVVAVRARGHTPFIETVTVEAMATSLHVALSADPADTLRNPGEPSGDLSRLVAAARTFGRSLIVVDVHAAGRHLRVTAVDHERHRTAQAVGDLARIDGIAAELADSLTERPVAPFVESPDEEADPWPWIVGTAGGVVLVGLATLAVVLAVSDSGPSQWEATGLRRDPP